MNGVSRINITENVMMISYANTDSTFLAHSLNSLSEAGVVIDMVSQTPPLGKTLSFSFSAPFSFFENALKALGGDEKTITPMISGGYSKIYLYGEEMVNTPGVAAKAISALLGAGIEIYMITTSDLDISLLVRNEDVDTAVQKLGEVFDVKV